MYTDIFRSAAATCEANPRELRAEAFAQLSKTLAELPKKGPHEQRQATQAVRSLLSGGHRDFANLMKVVGFIGRDNPDVANIFLNLLRGGEYTAIERETIIWGLSSFASEMHRLAERPASSRPVADRSGRKRSPERERRKR